MFRQLDLFESAIVGDDDTTLDNKPTEIKKTEKKLTPRQWRLLDLIKHNSLVENRKTTQKEICDTIDGYEWDEDEKSHDHCVAIWTDIKDINLSYQTDKLIISKNFEYWIGDRDETQAFIDKLWSDLCPRLIRYWAYLTKVNRDGQGLLIDRKGNVIDENSQARVFIESYGKERISDN